MRRDRRFPAEKGLVGKTVDLHICPIHEMKSKTKQRAQQMHSVEGQGPNWILIAGGALLSTMAMRFGCKLNQFFQNKHSNNTTAVTKERAKSTSRRRSGACQLHPNLHCYNPEEESCYHYPADDVLDIKLASNNSISKEEDTPLPLTRYPTEESNKNAVMWPSSPDRLALPQKPFRHSNSSESPCVSESGSDIYVKREVIQKLRQQIQRRDEMIMEMQSQIMDLRSSLGIQMAHSANLQSQIDTANRDLFESEREIQRLRKAIADYCLAEVGSLEKPGSGRSCRSELTNGHMDDAELQHDGEAGGDKEKVALLKREVAELREVIEGKDFLLQSYKEQKVELCSKIKELQLQLASQVPNIL